MPVASLAEISGLFSYSWVATGDIGDCSGNDRSDLTDGDVPLASECNSEIEGLAAICWDQVTYVGLEDHAVYTYKSLTPEACTGGALPGVVYECMASGSTAASAGPFAYVTNYGSNTVSVIDGATNGVTANVPIGLSPVGVAVTPDRAYVANYGSDTISVL